MRLFGFEIKRPEEDVNDVKPFAIPANDDGAINVGTALGGSYGLLFNMEATFKSESDLVTQYRSMAMQPEVRFAVDNIVNDAISIDAENNIVKIVLDDVELGDKTKERIYEEFDNILKLLDFSNNAYEIFQKWYVDGRLHYNVVIDEKNLKRGIVDLIYIDPRKIRMIRDIVEQPDNEVANAIIRKIKKEYYLYSETGFGSNFNATQASAQGGLQSYTGSVTNDTTRIAKDSVVRITSGLVTEDNSMVLSYLHSSIKPLNLLRSLEDANVIYTITRAPERRIFYIDVGNLPTNKAEQYLHSMMVRHKNKVTYDNVSGVISDDRRFMTMTEDFWFPRREGNRTTEIDVLQGAGSLSDNDQLEYFKNNLYKSLNIPSSRFEAENTFSLGRATEMSREEVMFAKFIRRLRARFSSLFDKLLEKQLILKGVITPDEWPELRERIRYDFMKDNYFEELKSMEILREKIALFQSMSDMIGKHFSTRWAYKNIMFMGDDEMEAMRKEIEEERNLGYYDDPNMFDDGNMLSDAEAQEYADGLDGFEGEEELEGEEDDKKKAPPKKKAKNSDDEDTDGGEDKASKTKTE